MQLKTKTIKKKYVAEQTSKPTRQRIPGHTTTETGGFYVVKKILLFGIHKTTPGTGLMKGTGQYWAPGRARVFVLG